MCVVVRMLKYLLYFVFVFCQNPLTTRFKYFAFRLLELSIQLDSGSILTFLSDFLGDMKMLSHDQIIAMTLPEKWINEFNIKLLSPENRSQFVDVYKAQVKAEQSKMYFEQFVIHPLKLYLTFMHTEVHTVLMLNIHFLTSHFISQVPARKSRLVGSHTLLNVMASLAAVDLMELRFTYLGCHVFVAVITNNQV